MVGSVEASLRRLNTDYIDLLYLHAWDDPTAGEEVLQAMDDLVRAGKVLYAGISDTPAWQVSRMQAIANLRGWAPLVAPQIEYSLVEHRKPAGQPGESARYRSRLSPRLLGTTDDPRRHVRWRQDQIAFGRSARLISP